MEEPIKRDFPTTVRLTASERAAVETKAAAEGKAISKYIEGVLLGEVHRPKPTLAAAGALLAICRALVDAADRGLLDEETSSFVSDQAALLFELLRQHGHEGYCDDRE